MSRSAGICAVSGAAQNARGPDHCLRFDALAIGQGDAGFVERGDTDTESGLHADLLQRILDDGTRIFAHVGGDRLIALNDDDARFGAAAKTLAEACRHLGCRLDAGEAAAGNHDRVTSVCSRTVGQAMQMLVKGNRIVKRVDAETMLRKTGNVRTEQPAARCHDQAIVGELLSFCPGGRNAHFARLGIDRLGAALHVEYVDRLEDIQQRRSQRLGLRLVEPWANHQRRLWCDQRDLELLGRSALDVAQAGGGQCGIHAGKAGANNDQSHVISPLV